MLAAFDLRLWLGYKQASNGSIDDQHHMKPTNHEPTTNNSTLTTNSEAPHHDTTKTASCSNINRKKLFGKSLTRMFRRSHSSTSSNAIKLQVEEEEEESLTLQSSASSGISKNKQTLGILTVENAEAQLALV